jgi:outer membrane protein TolC
MSRQSTFTMPCPRLASSALALGLLAGCSTYEAKELNPATTQTQLESRTLADAGLTRTLTSHGAPVDGEWDLARFTLAAFYFSPELDVARAQLAELEAGVTTAAARPNPTLNFTPGYNPSATGGVTPWILGYALDLPLELAGQRFYRTAEAQHQAEAARLTVAGTAWSVRHTVRRALLELHAATAAAALWREQTPLLEQAAHLVDAQVKAGEASPLEAAQTSVALHRAELAARESARTVHEARSRLAEAIGVSAAALANVNPSFRSLNDATAIDAPEARRWAAQNRADLLSALAAYAASQSALQTEIARQYPDLSFGPGYQLDQGEGKWALSLGVTLPLFHRNQGPIALAQARRETAAAKFIALQNHVLAEIDRTVADVTSARASLVTVEKIRHGLDRQTTTAKARLAAGEISRLDLARAQLDRVDTARAELEARGRVEQALAALEDAVQRPLAWPDSAWRAPRRSTAN